MFIQSKNRQLLVNSSSSSSSSSSSHDSGHVSGSGVGGSHEVMEIVEASNLNINSNSNSSSGSTSCAASVGGGSQELILPQGSQRNGGVTPPSVVKREHNNNNNININNNNSNGGSSNKRTFNLSFSFAGGGGGVGSGNEGNQHTHNNNNSNNGNSNSNSNNNNNNTNINNSNKFLGAVKAGEHFWSSMTSNNAAQLSFGAGSSRSSSLSSSAASTSSNSSSVSPSALASTSTLSSEVSGPGGPLCSKTAVKGNVGIGSGGYGNGMMFEVSERPQQQQQQQQGIGGYTATMSRLMGGGAVAPLNLLLTATGGSTSSVFYKMDIGYNTNNDTAEHGPVNNSNYFYFL